MTTEPVLTASGIAGLVGAIMTLFVAFGLQLTDDQQKAILALVVLLAPILAALWARTQVRPQAKIDQVPVAAEALRQADQRNDEKRVKPYLDSLREK